MTYDSTLGQLLDGSNLPLLAPNATKDQQTTTLNEIISILNNFSRDVVGSGDVTMTLTNQGSQLLVVPHNLGYVPQAFVYLQNVSPTVNGTTYPHSNVPLPTYLADFTDTFTDVGSNNEALVAFTSWLDYFVDATNLYIRLATTINYSGTVIPMKYYFTRNPVS